MVELERPISSSDGLLGARHGVYEIIASRTERLSLGGSEGTKSRIAIRNPRHHEGRGDVSETLPFILKTFKGRGKEEILLDIWVYHDLRRKGYPVPETLRYFEEDGVRHILMSDLTCQGECLVWGNSVNMTEQQYSDLLLMDLSDKEVKIIEKKARGFAEKLSRDGTALGHNCYHVRKNLNTGEVDIVFLDVHGLTSLLGIVSCNGLVEFNQSSVDTFIESLRVSVSKAEEKFLQSSC